MPEHRLQPLLPLAGKSPRADTFDGLAITESANLAMASLTCRLGRSEDFARTALAVFGMAMPRPGLVKAQPPFAAIWIGPDQWLIEAPFDTHEDIARIVKDKMGGTASVTEQTDGWARFEVEGPRAADVFERLCALDIRSMQTGAASRTLVEHLGCLVVCREAGQRFSVLGPRSAAGSLHHALVTAAQSAI